MNRRKAWLNTGLFVLSFFLFCSQAVEPYKTTREELQNLQSRAVENLDSLTNSIEMMRLNIAELENSKTALEQSQIDLEQSRTTLAENLQQRQAALESLGELYSESLTLLSTYSITSRTLEEKLKQEKKLVLTLGLILGFLLLLKTVRIVVGFAYPVVNKLIPLWLDILI